MYQLSMTIDAKSLQTINSAGLSVIVAKPNGGGLPNVAWVAFRPLTSNTMTWEEEYGIYASTAQVQGGAQLTQLTSTGVPAALGQLYTLSANGFFTGPTPGGTPDGYTALNDWTQNPAMTFGLYQNASVNGTSILNSAVSASSVPAKLSAAMTPYTTVYVWLQGNTASSSVLTTVSSTQTKVTFSPGSSTAALVWDPVNGQFDLSQPGKGAVVQQYVPSIL
jgi:hypothetical protein